MLKRTFAMRPMGLLPIALLATACVTSPPIIAEATGCSRLVPDGWREGVKGAPAPAEVAHVETPVGTPEVDVLKLLLMEERRRGDNWRAFGVAQTANLEKANGRTADALGIIERCEARDRVAVDRARPRFLGLF